MSTVSPIYFWDIDKTSVYLHTYCQFSIVYPLLINCLDYMYTRLYTGLCTGPYAGPYTALYAAPYTDYILGYILDYTLGYTLH